MNTSVRFAKHLNERGLEYEEMAVRFLRENGYSVRFDKAHEVWDVDLTVEPNISVEVKGSRRRKLRHGKEGYGFLLHKAGHSKPIHEPVTMLICYDQTAELVYPFVVPTRLLDGRSYIEFRNSVPHEAAGKWTGYYNALRVLDELGARRN